MKATKTALLLLICAALLSTFFIACKPSESGGDNSGQPSGSSSPPPSVIVPQTPDESIPPVEELELITIEWLGTGTSYLLDGAFPEDRVIKALEERTKVRIDWGINVGLTDVNSRIMMMLSSGTLPDIVMPVSSAEVGRRLVEAGAVYQLDDLVAKYGHNIIENAGKMLAYNKLTKSDDTNALYCLSVDVGNSTLGDLAIDASWSLRWDLYKQLGYPPINSYDDFLNVLKDMLALEPENADGRKNYAFGLFLAEDWGHQMIDRAMMFEQGKNGLNVCQVNTVDLTIEPRLNDPDGVFWQSMEFWNKAYSMGLLDTESATLKYQTYIDKMSTNRYLAAGNSWMVAGSHNNLYRDSGGEKGFMPIMIDPNPDGVYFISELQVGSLSSAYISKNCKYPERVMMLFDYLATSEAYELLLNGVQGTDWDYDENGIPVLIGETRQQAYDGAIDPTLTGIGKYSWQLGLIKPGYNLEKGYFTRYMTNTHYDEGPPSLYTDYYDFYNITHLQENFIKFPKFTYDYGFNSIVVAEPNTEYDYIDIDIQSYLLTDILKLVFAASPEEFQAGKTKCIEHINSLGAEKLVDYYSQKWNDFHGQLNAMSQFN